tara:strand:+ start:1040 stop:1573 length:534 start_codon:yes stop_codon:yes gene_type:complete
MVPEKYSDTRGYFYESWNKDIFNEILKREVSFVQDNHSLSRYGVLRGLHFQKRGDSQAKLVRVISGKIFDVIVDIRIHSSTFKEWALIELSKKNRKQLWIPEGFAHGFITVSKTAEVNYKTNNFWNKDSERTIIWNDKDLKINWKLKELKLKNPLVSKKDNSGDPLNYLKNKRDLLL